MLRALTCLLAALLLGGCSDDVPLQPGERQLLLTSAAFGYPEREAHGRFGKLTSYWTRTTDLSYDYRDSPRLFLHSTVSLLPTSGDALLTSYGAMQGAGIGLGLGDGELSQEELPLQRQFGSHAKLVLLRNDGAPMGNMFSVSVGRKVFFTVFTGRHHFTSAAEFERFIAPTLAALEAHEPEDPLLGWGRRLFADEREGGDPR